MFYSCVFIQHNHGYVESEFKEPLCTSRNMRYIKTVYRRPAETEHAAVQCEHACKFILSPCVGHPVQIPAALSPLIQITHLHVFVVAPGGSLPGGTQQRESFIQTPHTTRVYASCLSEAKAEEAWHWFKAFKKTSQCVSGILLTHSKSTQSGISDLQTCSYVSCGHSGAEETQNTLLFLCPQQTCRRSLISQSHIWVHFDTFVVTCCNINSFSSILVSSTTIRKYITI